MKKIIIIMLLLLFVFGILYSNVSKYLLGENKAKKIVGPALIPISDYIKRNNKFPQDLNDVENFPYKNLEKNHNEGWCDTCFSYPLVDSIYHGYALVETNSNYKSFVYDDEISDNKKSKFYFEVLFAEVRFGIRSCSYFFDLDGSYNGKCYKAQGFGINR